MKSELLQKVARTLGHHRSLMWLWGNDANHGLLEGEDLNIAVPTDDKIIRENIVMKLQNAGFVVLYTDTNKKTKTMRLKMDHCKLKMNDPYLDLYFLSKNKKGWVDVKGRWTPASFHVVRKHGIQLKKPATFIQRLLKSEDNHIDRKKWRVEGCRNSK
jgi:hypothetical protein